MLLMLTLCNHPVAKVLVIQKTYSFTRSKQPSRSAILQFCRNTIQ